MEAIKMTSERYARGSSVLAAMNNDPNANAAWRRIDPVAGPELDRMLGEFCWGDVWARDGLDLRDRRVVTLAAIATLGVQGPLSGHIRMAVEQGFQRRQILEIFIHLIPYVGFPTALTAIQSAEQVFAALDAASAQEPVGE